MKSHVEAVRDVDLHYSRELDLASGVVIFTALTAIGAKVYIPNEPIPFTLQTLFVVLAGAFLGRRGGTFAMVLYLLLGAAGAPIFAGPEAGIHVFLGTTAGYLLGFVLSAAVVGTMIEFSESLLWTFATMFIGFLVTFTCGTIWLDLFFVHNWGVSLTQGFLIFSLWDFVKLGAAVAIYRTWPARTRITNI